MITPALAASDWWRCPLSGRVMRDPVLIGSMGDSFEREALEEVAGSQPWGGSAQQAADCSWGGSNGSEPRPAKSDSAAAFGLTRHMQNFHVETLVHSLLARTVVTADASAASSAMCDSTYKS